MLAGVLWLAAVALPASAEPTAIRIGMQYGLVYLQVMVAQKEGLFDARAKAAGRPAAEEERALLAEKQPLLRFTQPDQIGALCVFLCSDAAATMTGAPISIDGGWTSQ